MRPRIPLASGGSQGWKHFRIIKCKIKLIENEVRSMHSSPPPTAMDVRLLRRPVCDLFFGRSYCLLACNVAARRNESTFQRTKKKLNVKPDSSFVFSRFSPNQDHIIFNPPSSAPSVLHTPLKFLPKDDKRRQLLTNTPRSTIGISSSSLPPPVIKLKPGYQRHHLSEEDVAEMRRLRATDPENWTRIKLAKKYNCSSLFVRMCCEATKEEIEATKARMEAMKARWGPKRRKAREDRVKRREASYRDE